MTEHRFTDAATIKGARKTQDGYLIAEAFVARSGVQLYRGAEMGLADRDVVRVWRPQDEVMQPASVQGYSHTPITMNHPTEFVTADNWAALAKGEVSTEAEWKDGRLRLPLIVKDADAIAAIEGGTRELSAGYMCRVEMQDGVTPEGEQYDAVQRDIRINHLAIVPKGRAGSECRIGDGADDWGLSPLTDARKEVSMTTRKIMVDGLEVETTDAGAAAIQKLQGDITAKAKALTDAETAHADAIKLKDEEIGTLKADKKALEDAAMTPEKMRQAVQDRAALEATVKAVDGKIDLSQADADLRKAAVASKWGDDMVKDASEAEVSGMFKAIAKDAAKGKDTFRAAAADGALTQPAADGDYGQAAYQKRIGDAWKSNPAAKEA